MKSIKAPLELSTSACLTHWKFKHSHWEKRDAFSVEIPTDCPEQPFRSTLGSMFCRRQIFENEIQSSLLESLTKIHWKRPAEEVGDKNVETELAKTRARGFSGIRANLLKPYHYRGAAG